MSNILLRHIRTMTLLLLTYMSASQCADAEDRWFDSPIEMPAGMYVIGHAEDVVGQMSLHLRAKPPTPATVRWGVAWACAGDGSMERVMLTVPRRGAFDDIILPKATVTLERIAYGHAEILQQVDVSGFNFDGGENSIVVNFTDGVLRVSGGESESQQFFSMPFSVRPGEIAIVTDTPLSFRRIKADVASAGIPRSRFATIDALDLYLSRSVDPIEGYWEYLDRKTDPKKAEIGGRYVVAIVRNADHYDMVYIFGARVASGQWKPLFLKGRLMPTGFVGNYDMEWIDSQGCHITGDSNAQLSDDKTILSLRLPDLGAELRFAKRAM